MDHAVTRIIVADHHPLVGEWLECRLKQAGIHIETTARIDDALTRLESRDADMLVVEPAAPGMDAFAATAALKRERPEAPVAFLCGTVRTAVLRGALDAGAAAFFGKVDEPGRIARGIRSAAQGRYAFGPSAFALCPDLRRLDGAPCRKQHGANVAVASNLASLTPREREILILLAKGLRRSEIARRLHRSPKTIDKHRGSLMRKLDIHDRAQLVLFAVREGLVSA